MTSRNFIEFFIPIPNLRALQLFSNFLLNFRLYNCRHIILDPYSCDIIYGRPLRPCPKNQIIYTKIYQRKQFRVYPFASECLIVIVLKTPEQSSTEKATKRDYLNEAFLVNKKLNFHLLSLLFQSKQLLKYLIFSGNLFV